MRKLIIKSNKERWLFLLNKLKTRDYMALQMAGAPTVQSFQHFLQFFNGYHVRMEVDVCFPKRRFVYF